METNPSLKQLSAVLFEDLHKHSHKSKDEIEISKRFSEMKRRCYNPQYNAYKNYGGRGIYICEEWLRDRTKFIEWSLTHGFKPELSIDRIDVNGPYAPWNCRWTDSITQANNKTSNLYLTVDNTKKSLGEWTTFLKCKSAKVLYYLYQEDPEDAKWFVKYMLNQRN